MFARWLWQRLHLLRLQSNPDGCDGGCFHLTKNGNLRIEMHGATALEQTLNVVVYGEFEVMLEIGQRSQHHIQLLMETDHISRLLARDPLICHYEVVTKCTVPEVISTCPSAIMCTTRRRPTGRILVRHVCGRDRRLLRPVRTKSATRRVDKHL